MEDSVRLMSVILAVLIFAPSPASAQPFVENQTWLRAAGTQLVMEAEIEVPGTPVNFFSWFLVNDEWGEGLVGVSKSVKPWLWLASAAGVEKADTPLRFSQNVWAGKGRLSTVFTMEYGGSGMWYMNKGLVKVAPRLELGYHSQRFYGTGPMLKISLTQKFSVWASVINGPQSIIGIHKTF